MHAHIAAAGGIWGAPVHVHVYSLCFKGAPYTKGSQLGSSRCDVGDRERRVCIREYPAAKGVGYRRASPLGASLERR
jgi:hypothetical protein